MKTILHKADSRGYASHGWLQSYHTFSFANYFNPERMNFGALRVLNDDTVAGGRGFDTHQHRDAEIISIPLSGDLEHKDSIGNTTIIKEGEVQVMSAGTGVAHSEYNKNSDKEVKFLQIWVIPREMGVAPRYDQIELDATRTNKLVQIISPNQDDEGMWIHQDAWFSLGSFTEDTERTYNINKDGNGVYAFLLDGEATIAGETVSARDGLGITETDEFTLEMKEGSRLLLIEVPMIQL